MPKPAAQLSEKATLVRSASQELAQRLNIAPAADSSNPKDTAPLQALWVTYFGVRDAEVSSTLSLTADYKVMPTNSQPSGALAPLNIGVSGGRMRATELISSVVSVNTFAPRV